jgi:hypothetical protein
MDNLLLLDHPNSDFLPKSVWEGGVLVVDYSRLWLPDHV